MSPTRLPTPGVQCLLLFLSLHLVFVAPDCPSTLIGGSFSGVPPSSNPPSTTTTTNCPDVLRTTPYTYTCNAGYYAVNTIQGTCTATFTCNVCTTNSCSSWTPPNFVFSPKNARCALCSPGKFSLGGDTKCDSCASGTYNLNPGGQSEEACVVCPAGNYCPSPESLVPCPSNAYSDKGSVICTTCEPGSQCNGGLKMFCPPGSSSLGGADQCSQCIPGTYCRGAAPSKQCSPGTFTSEYNQTNCQLCPPGYYTNNSTGFTACAPSPAGYFIPASGASTFLPSGPGKFTSVPGATLPTPCPPGNYSDSLTATVCKGCAPGSFSGPGQERCTDCNSLPGTYCNSTGASLPCPVGSYCLGTNDPPIDCGPGNFIKNNFAFDCQPCKPGTYGSSTKGVTNCMECPFGTFANTTGSTSCTLCGAGRYSEKTAQDSNRTCSLCEPGSYSNPGSRFCTLCAAGKSTDFLPGASTCTDCLPGWTAKFNGSASCTQCQANTYSAIPGGTTCQKCKSLYTSLPGSPSCYALGYVCDPGRQPLSPILPLLSSDCVPLICPPYLNLKTEGCVGCPANEFGDARECKPCPVTDRVCPGNLPWPILNDTSQLASGVRLVGAPPKGWGGSGGSGGAAGSTTTLSTLSSQPPPQCVAASLYTPTLVTLLPPPFSYFTLRTMAVVIVAAGLSTLLFLVHAISNSLPSTSFATRFQSSLEYVDNFGAAHKVNAGDAIKHLPTPLGGLCTLMSLFTLATCTTLLVLRYVYDNATLSTTLNYVTPARTPFSPGMPWATPFSPPFTLPPSTTIQVRLFAPVEQGCNATLSGIPPAAVGANGGAWNMSAVTDCGDGRSLLVFTCAGCALDAGSSLSIFLPYTCQSLYLEALGVDATGEVQVLTFPPSVLSPWNKALKPDPSTLLRTVAWELLPMASLFNNNIQGYAVRGMRLGVGPATVTYTSPGDALLPLYSAVTVTVKLNLDTSFSVTSLDPTQTLAQLLASVVGLLGILSGFRFLFGILESYLNGRAKPPPHSKRWNKKRVQWVVSHLPLPEAKNAPGVGSSSSFFSNSSNSFSSSSSSSSSSLSSHVLRPPLSSSSLSTSSSSLNTAPYLQNEGPSLAGERQQEQEQWQQQPSQALLTAPPQIQMVEEGTTTTTTTDTTFGPPDESGYVGEGEEEEEEEPELSLHLPTLRGSKRALPAVVQVEGGGKEKVGEGEEELYSVPTLDIPTLRPITPAPSPPPFFVRKKER